MVEITSKQIGYRPTWAEIDLRNLLHNLRQVRQIVSFKTKIMACVKADAYGHGLIPVARALSKAADSFSVASIDEAILLRKAKITLPILVLGNILKEDIAPLVTHDISQTVCSRELAVALDKIAGQKGRKIKVHVKIDTGMGRIGVVHTEALNFIRKIRGLKNLQFEGIYTHFSCADTNPNFTMYQLGVFEEILMDLSKHGIIFPYVHAANSLGIVNYKSSHFNVVRPGLILYGLSLQENVPVNLKPVLSLKTKVVYVKKVPAGWGISYGHTYVTENDTFIATLPVGYGDGYPRNLSNKAPVLIKGRLLKVCGTVCMDQTMVDVGNLKVKAGDEVVLIGTQAGKHITTEELARLSGTIPYEIVCGLGSRIPRIYTS